MPKLPTFDQLPAESPRPSTAAVGYRATSGAETAPGETVASVGHALEAESEKLWHLARQEKEKADTVKVEDAWNQYKTSTLDLAHGKEGLLNTRGADAVNGNLWEKATTSLSASRKQIAEGLVDDQQRQRFNERANITDLQTKHQLLTHLATEQKTYARVTMEGSEAAAKAQVAANPGDDIDFMRAQSTVMAQADVYLKGNGIKDQGVIDAFKAKINDGLWVSRIDALLYSQPLVADSLFRANAGQIKDPIQRLKLQSQTREAALSVNASIEAQRVIDEQRAAMPPPGQPQERATPEGGPSRGGTLDTGAPRSVRNNNPGNIEKSSYKWQGEVAGDDSRFVTFATPQDGLRAMQQNLLTYQDKHGLNTVQGIISRWAPAKENGAASTNNYIARVAGALGVAPGDKIDLHDPATMGKMVDAMSAVEAGGSSGGTQTVAYRSASPLEQNTSGLPNSRDVAAQLPVMLGRVEETATRLYGNDPTNPDRAAFVKRMTSELHGKLAAEVQQLNAIQRQAQGVLLDAISGIGQATEGNLRAGGSGVARPMITSFSQIQSDPKLMRAWQLVADPQVKLGMASLIEKQLTNSQKNDEVLFRQMFNRIHLEPGDPAKIDFYRQIVDPAVVDRLSIQQIGTLRLEIDRAETPGGRSLNQMRKAADANVSTFFRTNIMFTAQPERQIAAIMRWNEDAGAKIDQYVKEGKDVRSLFQLDTKDSIVNPAYLQTYVNSTPARGLAEAAAKAKTGQPEAQQPGVFTTEQIAKLPQLPATVKTREEAMKWMNEQPPEVTAIRDETGMPRWIPGRKPGKPAAAAKAAPVTAGTGDSDEPAAPQLPERYKRRRGE